MNNEENNNVNPLNVDNSLNSDTSTPVSSFDNVAPVEPTPVAPVQETVAPVQGEVTPSVEPTPVQDAVAPVQSEVVEITPNVETTPAVETPAQTPFQETPAESVGFEEPKKKNKAVKILVAVVIVLALAVAGFYCYTNFVLVTGKNVVKTSITKSFDALISTIDKAEKKSLVIDPSKDVVGVSGSINFASNYKDQSIDLTNLSKYSIKYDSAFDMSSESMFITAILDREGTSLLDGNILVKNNKLTFGSDKLSLYSYSTQLPTTFKVEYKQTVTFSDVKKLVEKAKATTISNIDESKITKSTGSRQNKNYTKVTYALNVGKIMSDITNAYLNDNEAIDILSRLTGKSTDQVTKALKESLDEYKSYDDIQLDIYVDNLFANFVGLSLTNPKSKGSIELDKIDGNYQFACNDILDAPLKGNYMTDTKTLNIYYTDKYSVELSIKEVSDTKINVSFNVGYEEQKMSVNMDLENTVSGNTQTVKVSSKVKVTADGETIDFTVNSETNITKGAEIKDNTSMFVKDISEMTYEEISDMETKAMEIVYSVLGDFMSFTPYTSYDYSSDLSL